MTGPTQDLAGAGPATAAAADGPVWQPAMALLDELGRAAETAAVLRDALRAGLLERLRRSADVHELAGACRAAPARVAVVLQVLEATGVARRSEDRWSLTPPWEALVAGGSPADLPAFLDGPRVRSAQFEAALTGGHDYWHLEPSERLTVARAVSFDPASPAMPGLLRRDLGMLDGVLEALEAGGRVLELGCGVGSRLTALALTFPALRGVGVELDADLVAYGRRRAERLGVADRVTYVVGDATAHVADDPCDLVNWSQFFFPTSTREAAVRTAWSSLRPGGWITAPAIWPDEAPEQDAARRGLALEALNLELSGVPPRSVGEVRAELEAAGFADTRVDDMVFISLVRGRRPQG